MRALIVYVEQQGGGYKVNYYALDIVRRNGWLGRLGLEKVASSEEGPLLGYDDKPHPSLESVAWEASDMYQSGYEEMYISAGPNLTRELKASIAKKEPTIKFPSPFRSFYIASKHSIKNIAKSLINLKR